MKYQIGRKTEDERPKCRERAIHTFLKMIIVQRRGHLDHASFIKVFLALYCPLAVPHTLAVCTLQLLTPSSTWIQQPHRQQDHLSVKVAIAEPQNLLRVVFATNKTKAWKGDFLPIDG
jgi:hypothetical protein